MRGVLCLLMKIKFGIVCNDVLGSYVSDEGELEVKKFNGYELFCKLYERMEGEGSVCGVNEREFNEVYKVIEMGDWLIVKDNNGVEVMNFVKI